MQRDLPTLSLSLHFHFPLLSHPSLSPFSSVSSSHSVVLVYSLRTALVSFSHTLTDCISWPVIRTMSACKDEDPRIHGIKSNIRVVPDFPKPGIQFQDITTLLLEPKAFKHTIDMFVERYKGKNISVVAGIEARGFIFGPPIALAIGAKFVPLRKPKKLPGEVISEEYILEYGRDCLEMHVGAVEASERALVVDDLIATGGTLCAAMNLLERAGAEVVECACVIELPELKGRERLRGKALYVLVECQ